MSTKDDTYKYYCHCQTLEDLQISDRREDIGWAVLPGDTGNGI
jgi:hypothetical protein